MRISSLELNSIRATYLVLQEVKRQAGLSHDLHAAAATASVGDPSLSAIRLGLWADQPAHVLAWAQALTRARVVLDQLLLPDADADIRELAHWANRHFPSAAQLAGHRVTHELGRGWTMELAE